MHEHRNTANEEETEALNKKSELLDSLKDVKLVKDNTKNLEFIGSKVDEWKNLGKLPFNKRHLESKFKKVINALYNKLDMEQGEIEMLKFERKIESFSEPGNKHLLDNEMNYIRKKIDDIRSEINQLENNLQFFSNVDNDNPVVKEVHDKIDRQRASLNSWEEKHKRIKKYY